MKKSELQAIFNKKNCLVEDIIPSEWIGQGYGFKVYEWENID